MPLAVADSELRQRLYDDTPFWCRHCAKILDKETNRLVPLVPNEPQLRLELALQSQQQAGKPMRAIVLKARKLGFSTFTQAKIQHRITQRPYRRALVVAQDGDTAGVLFEIGERMWANLPDDDRLGNLKPELVNRRKARYLLYGEASKRLRDKGERGLDSSLEVDTANEVDAGRGYTYTELHCSEVAFWPDVAKLTALLNAVPNTPETMIVLESTANGPNHFKDRWDRAVAGESAYLPVFAAWHEDPLNSLRFDSVEDREAFEADIGQGEFGEDEPRLIEQFDLTLEQLNWRRWAIVDLADSDVEVFKQEHPASPEEAFMASGEHVFSMALVSRVIDQTTDTDGEAELGELAPQRVVQRKVRSGIVDVPTNPKWVAKDNSRGYTIRHPFWRVWHHPEEGERFVVACDPASDEETARSDTRDKAWTAIQVVDHRTKQQVAEYRSRKDWDEIARELFLVSHYYNRAICAIETTGGWGGAMAKRMWREYGYPLMYKRRPLDRAKEKQEDRLGWDTNRSSKVFLEDGARELLREGTHGIKSALLAQEFTFYVRDDTGKSGPAPGKHSDLLMAWMIAQHIAQERVVPSDGAKSRRQMWRPRDPVTGW